jgi:hypothetical protein
MIYCDLYNYLKEKVAYGQDRVDLPEIGQKVLTFSFRSESSDLLANAYKRPDLLPLGDLPAELREAAEIQNAITLIPDPDIDENKNFRYHMIMPEGLEEADSAIALLHGFNERHWHKYLPWGSFLSKETGQAVVFFPTAFHKNRSPDLWNDSHAMRAVSQLRKKLYPEIIHSTLSNAAISVRLSANPGRFFWSGLQTFNDVNLLASKIKKGEHPGIKKGARVNFFTYSIGTFLGEIVIMTNEGGMFSDSRFVAFCGGPVFNRLSPVSKFILDSEANVSVYSYLVEHLDSHVKNDAALEKHLGANCSPVGKNFRALINYRLDRDYREEKLASMADRILAVTFAKDEVVPPFEVVNTLQGTRRDIKIPVVEEDLPYPYRHEDPFPVGSKKTAELVDMSFLRIFKPICDFLKG